VARNPIGLAVNDQIPIDPTLSWVTPWNLKSEDTPLPAGLKPSRLGTVEFFRLDKIILAQRNMDNFLSVPVMVSKVDSERAIFILVPALKSWPHRLIGASYRSEWKCLGPCWRSRGGGPNDSYSQENSGALHMVMLLSALAFRLLVIHGP
jgi:hypothetical protein